MDAPEPKSATEAAEGRRLCAEDAQKKAPGRPISDEHEQDAAHHELSPETEAERGAITIHVAIALMALLVFSSFVIDYGFMWVSRRQAQNAADAGALAGAISLMQDGGTSAARKGLG